MKPQQQVNIKNKRASFDYELVERFTAGIVLYGTEIKSIREGKASLVDTYCQFSNGELWVRNMQISAYRLGYYYNHDVKRERKLLLNKRELRKLEKATKETGGYDLRTFEIQAVPRNKVYGLRPGMSGILTIENWKFKIESFGRDVSITQ